MICPVSGVAALGALVSGVHRLLFADRRFRILSAAVAIGLAAGWTGYFLLGREPGARIALEVLSVAALGAGGLRLRHLLMSREVAPLLGGALAPVTRAFTHVLSSPWVAGVKGWLLAMLTLQALGRAQFHLAEYAVVVAVLALLVGARLFVRRPEPRRFAALEAFAPACDSPACPLGLGRGESVAPRTSVPGA